MAESHLFPITLNQRVVGPIPTSPTIFQPQLYSGRDFPRTAPKRAQSGRFLTAPGLFGIGSDRCPAARGTALGTLSAAPPKYFQTMAQLEHYAKSIKIILGITPALKKCRRHHVALLVNA